MRAPSPAHPRRALVFGAPGSGVEVVADELSHGFDEVRAWDGTEPWSGSEPSHGAESAEWSLVVRTVSAEGRSLGRLLRNGRAKSLDQGLEIMKTSLLRQRGLRVRARVILDTSRLGEAQLRGRVSSLLAAGLGQGAKPVVVLESFAYPNGVPLDLDWCGDVRGLRNPYWDEALRPLSGIDPRIRDYVLQQPLAQRLLERFERLVLDEMPTWTDQKRQVVRLALGCTGGFHRSVALCQELGDRLTTQGVSTLRWHRELPD